MSKYQRQNHNNNASSYLKKVGNRFVYDPTSRLYKHKADEHDENRSTDTTGRYERFPFWINVRRDWVAIAISGLGLVMLFAAILYARQQWMETKKAVDASKTAIVLSSIENFQQSFLGMVMAQESIKATKLSTEQSRLAKIASDAQISSSRAILDLDIFSTPDVKPVINQPGIVSFEFTVKNVGLTDAINIKYSLGSGHRINWSRGLHRDRVMEDMPRSRVDFEGHFVSGSLHPIAGKSVSTESVKIPPFPLVSALIAADDGIYYLGQIQFDDLYHGKWTKRFCVMFGLGNHMNASTNRQDYVAEDCNIPGENVRPRIDPMPKRKNH